MDKQEANKQWNGLHMPVPNLNVIFPLILILEFENSGLGKAKLLGK